MSPAHRRWIVFLCLAALAAGPSACGPKKRGPQEPALTQAEADDLMQALASMAASDSGGWFVEIASTYERWRRGAPPPGPPSVAADSTFTAGSMTWSFRYAYFDTLGQQSALDSSTIWIEAGATATGRMPLRAFEGTTGDGRYGRRDTLFVDGLRRSDSTLSFFSLTDVDTVTMTFRSGTGARYYFFDNLVGYTLTMPKTANPPPIYPIGGEAQVDAFVDVLANPSRASRLKTLDAVMVVFFDGTERPVATITADTLEPTTVYRYRINLKTGAIARD